MGSETNLIECWFQIDTAFKLNGLTKNYLVMILITAEVDLMMSSFAKKPQSAFVRLQSFVID